MKRFIQTLLTIIITAIITFGITMIWVSHGSNESLQTLPIQMQNKEEINDIKMTKIKELIDQVFKGEIDENKMNEYIIKGYVAGLGDKYSVYYTQEEMEKMNTETSGEFVGIGVYITLSSSNQVVIYKVMKGSPAEKYGIKAGDILAGIDDKAITGDDYENTSDMVRGVRGTSVKLKLIRDGEEIVVNPVRDKVIIPEVEYQMLDNKIGYIYLQSFEGSAYKQFKAAFDDLKANNMEKLIVDIRNNGGGILTEATQIGDMFSDAGQNLIIQEDKYGNEDVIKAEKAKEINLPTVLLINGYSASASELLTSIVKDNTKNVTVIGTTTYGKGVVQTIYNLLDGSGIKLTTNEYFSPNHNSINGKGVEPHITVEDKEYTFDGNLNIEKDAQIKRAIEELNKK